MSHVGNPEPTQEPPVMDSMGGGVLGAQGQAQAAGTGTGVTRVVVVDYRRQSTRGRAFDSGVGCDVELVVQDDGRTLKAFLYDPKETP